MGPVGDDLGWQAEPCPGLSFSSFPHSAQLHSHIHSSFTRAHMRARVCVFEEYYFEGPTPSVCLEGLALCLGLPIGMREKQRCDFWDLQCTHFLLTCNQNARGRTRSCWISHHTRLKPTRLNDSKWGNFYEQQSAFSVWPHPHEVTSSSKMPNAVVPGLVFPSPFFSFSFFFEMTN